MKNRIKKSMALLLAVIMLLCAVPMNGSAAYENTYTNTGNQRKDIIGVAKTQVGYKEGYNNDTKYGTWYGLPNRPWCAMFISWCARQAGIPTSVLNNSAVAAPDAKYFNIPYYDGASYTPKSGDLFFTKSFSHVGLVYYIDGSYFYTIEGNSNTNGSSEGTSVVSNRRKISSHYFGVPNYSGSISHTVNSNYGKNFTSYPKAKITAGNIYDANHNQISSTAWIGTSDKCTIHEVYTDGCCKLSYPLDSGGTKTVYSKISLFNTHTHNYTGAKLYQPEHPHRFSQRCVDYDSCGGFIWLDEYYNDPNCSQCNRCTGYHMKASAEKINDGIYDSTAVDITITPLVNDREANDSEIESITLSLKNPNGEVLSGNYGTDRTRTFYFGTGDNANPYGKYVLWAKVNTKYGSYEGSESNRSIEITLKKSSLSNGYSFSETTTYRRIKFSDLNTYLTVKSDNNVVSNQRIGNNQSQIWKITKNSDGSNTITSMENGKVLDVDNAIYISGRNVLSYTSQNSDNQKWSFRKDKNELDGKFFISPFKSNSAVLDVYNGNKTNGTNVQIWTYNQGSAQKIEFELPYTINYNANGGSGAPSSQKKEYGKTLTLSSTKPTRNGYTFLGWSTSSSATSATYSAGASYSANADVTLYAVWKANTYTLTYDGNGFSSYSSKVNNVSTTTIKTDMPNRFGYNFNGWAKSKNGSAEYMPGASITLTANTTLYAVWSQDSMSSGTNFASIILAKGGINYYKFVPTKSGKYVVYSKGDKDPKVTLYNSSGTELAKNDDGGENKNFRLVYDLQAGTTYYYAFDFYGSSSFNVGFISVRFGPVYNISYNANGGSGVPSSQSKDWNKDIALSSTVPTRSGYTFLGWSTSSSATSATYKAGATYSANSNATLYAVWSKNTYTLSFNASGGTGAPQNMIGNTTYTIPSTVPKRFGWNFQGWRYLNDSGSYTYYKPGDKITINKNTTLTASWGGTSFSYPGVEAYSQINYPGEIHYIEYTSITTGKYVIYSYGEDDTYGYLYDSQGNILASNDDGGDGRNFRIEYNFIEGKTYYFGIKYYSSSKVGAIHSNFGRVYTINYNANGGSGAPASQSKDWNKNISLSTAIPTRKGYTFLGWSICGSISNPEVSVTFKAGATYSTNGNMTLYAVWKSNPCSHTYNSGKITTAATCKTTGVKTYTCTICKATKTETIAKNPANHVGGTKVKNATAATCTAKGYTGDTYCLGCGVVTVRGKDIAVKAHAYNSGKITTAATCKTTGVKTYTCTVCKATKTETIAKNPANHVGGTKVKNATAATCTAKGYTGDTYCLGCGVVTVKGTEISALGHTDSNSDGKCDRCGITLGEPEKPNTPDTPTANCTHLCHKGGFIWRIVRFFWKLFKINRNCSCGVAHY